MTDFTGRLLVKKKLVFMLQESGNQLSNYLKKTTVPTLSDEECKALYNQQVIHETMLCAGYPTGGYDACQVS